MLLSSLHKQDRIEGLRAELIYRSNMLDRESNEEVQAFNDLLHKYQELIYPKVRDRRYEKSAAEQLKSITNKKFIAKAQKDINEISRWKKK